jgi:uncharacterized membrane protein YwaF
MKIQEVLWAVFFTVLFGVIIGILIYMVPLVIFAGKEITSELGLWCSLAGMPTYWVMMLMYNKPKK